MVVVTGHREAKVRPGALCRCFRARMIQISTSPLQKTEFRVNAKGGDFRRKYYPTLTHTEKYNQLRGLMAVTLLSIPLIYYFFDIKITITPTHPNLSSWLTCQRDAQLLDHGSIRSGWTYRYMGLTAIQFRQLVQGLTCQWIVSC